MHPIPEDHAAACVRRQCPPPVLSAASLCRRRLKDWKRGQDVLTSSPFPGVGPGLREKNLSRLPAECVKLGFRI